jgi:signal transduction histidine kinase
LTLLYGGLFLVCGAALLAVTYTLVEHATVSNAPYREFVNAKQLPKGALPPNFQRATLRALAHPPTARIPESIQKLLKTASGRRAVFTVGSVQRISDLHQLVIESSIALAIMAIISGALGWVVAGRALAPLREMTAATQQISETNLHQRLAMTGPPDELRQLADTIDGLLGRLEGAFDAQRRFVANASHELRTPLTAVRALLEMVLSDPRATIGTFRTTCRQVLEESEQQEQLIDALLALAQGQRGIDAREPIDLAAIARDVLAAQEGAAAASGVLVDASLEPAPIEGDRRLIERLVSNLVDNALRYNVPRGNARIVVRTRGSHVDLDIVNTGPVVAADQIDRLLQPFQRLAGDRVGHGEGLGLGLSIVAAIATAHDAALEVKPGTQGGLEISVRFPRASEDDRIVGSPSDEQAVVERVSAAGRAD